MRPGKYSKRLHEKEKKDKGAYREELARSCYFCGGIFPHPKGRTSCPAYGKVCNACKLPNRFSKCCINREKVNQVDDAATSSPDC